MSVQVSAYDTNGLQHVVHDAVGLSWSSQRGASGSGFGYCRFSIPRDFRHKYIDLEYGYKLIVRKYLNHICFIGEIREISGKADQNSALQITCFGYAIVAQEDEISHVFCDTRLSRWVMESEISKSPFRPDRFVTQTNDQTLSLAIHPKNNTDIETPDHTQRVYEFVGDGETADKISFDLSLVLGEGTLFEATVDSVAAPDVVYTGDIGEGNLAADMWIYNNSQVGYAQISAVNVGTNTLTVVTASDVAEWVNGDELVVYGPRFAAQVQSLSGAVISYGGTILAESNLSASDWIVNISKKSVADISAVDAGADTITVTDEDDITGWQEGDLLITAASYFTATFSAMAGATITYASPAGETVASSTTGWVLYNESRDDYATVASWSPGTNQLDVTVAADIAGWVNGNTLRIYTPFKLEILDGDDTVIWPETDWREGAVAQIRTAVSLEPGTSTAQFKARLTCYISGRASEATFALLENLKVFSTTEAVGATELATYAVSILSNSGHGLSSSVSEIEVVDNPIEPMVFEFKRINEAMQWACGIGDGSGNLLSWGVTMDDELKLFLAAEDTQEVGYVVVPGEGGEVSTQGTKQGTFQQVRVVYKDKLGVQQATDWLSDSDFYFSSRYRRASIQAQNVDTEAEALAVGQLYLDENKDTKIQGSYSVRGGGLFTPYGLPMAVDEIRADGRYVRFESANIPAISGGTVLGDGAIEEQLVGAEIDYDNQSARLIPAAARSTFNEYIAELSRMSGR